MANPSTHDAGAPDHSAPFRPNPQFKPFNWIQTDSLSVRERLFAEFLSGARDVVHGAHTLSQLLNWDDCRRDVAYTSADPQPVLTPYHRHALERLMIASLGMLGEQIDEQCYRIERAQP